MTDFLLITIGLIQLVQIVIMLLILNSRNLDTNDYSKEYAQVQDLTERLRKSNAEVSQVLKQLGGK